MKCKNCKTENILKADYCKACGHQFTEKEKEKAYSKTIFGVIDKICDLKSYITLDFITGSRWFKAGILVVIVLYSFLMVKINGTQMRILDSGDYDVEYNKTTKEYYLVTDEQQVALNLYLPEKTDSISVLTVDDSEKQLTTDKYSVDESVILYYDSSYHYVIQSGRQQMELYLIKK